MKAVLMEHVGYLAANISTKRQLKAANASYSVLVKLPVTMEMCMNTWKIRTHTEERNRKMTVFDIEAPFLTHYKFVQCVETITY